MNYFKILDFLSCGNKGIFDIPAKDQMSYLLKLGPAKDDLDRSYKQYKCQNLFIPRYKRICFDIISVIILPIYLLVVYFKTYFDKDAFITSESADLVCEDKGMPETLPKSLLNKYKSIVFIKHGNGVYLNKQDIQFILHIIRKTSSAYFWLKSAIKISAYSYLIHKYTPKAIQVYSEYSFTSSVLTSVCSKYNVKHINVMHGEKLLYVRDSFFRFDKCYVWSDHYINLFVSMGADPRQFIIFLPESLCIDNEKFSNSTFYAEYKYYLGKASKMELQSIRDSLQFVKRQGKSLKVILHPRYSDIRLVSNVFDIDEIEDPLRVSIIESISNSHFVIGSYSTVLLQSYMSGKEVVLDDVTYKETYYKLAEYSYLLASKGCKTLSSMQEPN